MGKSGPNATPRPSHEAEPSRSFWEEEATVFAPGVPGMSDPEKPGPGPEKRALPPSGSAMAPRRQLPAAPELREPRQVSVFGRGRGQSAFGATGQVVEDDLSLLSLLRVRHDPERLWSDLVPLSLDPGQAKAHHLLPSHHEDPVGLLYDHLRTRLLQALAARDWHRVAIVAPTRGSGASTLAANLALSLARRPSGRSVLMDMNFRRPALAAMFGAEADSGPLRDLLTGLQPMEAMLHRFGRSLALGLNTRAEPDAAELLQEPDTAAALRQMTEDLAPDVVLYDMPPLLENDDLLAFLPQIDGVLLVVDASRNTAAQIRECERLLKGQTELLGVVMNRAEDSPVRKRLWPWGRAC